jgi:hypothetical protein
VRGGAIDPTREAKRPTGDRGNLDDVDVVIDEDEGGWAQFDGGPCDGRLDPLDPDAVELHVIMEDGQQHLYRRTAVQREVYERSVVVFEWAGRLYGLR